MVKTPYFASQKRQVIVLLIRQFFLLLKRARWAICMFFFYSEIIPATQATKIHNKSHICFNATTLFGPQKHTLSHAHFKWQILILADWTQSDFGSLLLLVQIQTLSTHRSVFCCWNWLVSHWQNPTPSFVCILNQISCSYFINSDKLTSDKPVVLSHFRLGNQPLEVMRVDCGKPEMWAFSGCIIVWGLAPGSRENHFL